MGWFLLLPLLSLPLVYWLVVMAMHRSPVHAAAVVIERTAPTSLSPLTAGVLYDGRLAERHLRAALTDLQARGGLSVEERDGTTFVKAGRPQAAKPVDALMARAMFDGAPNVDVAAAGERLLDARHALTALCEEDLLRRGLVRRHDFGAIGIFGFGLALTLGVILLMFVRFGFLAGLGAGLPLMILAQFAHVAATWRLPPTKDGLDIIGHLEGYRRYLVDVENGVETLIGPLEQHLPFALALDVELPLTPEAAVRLKSLEPLCP